MSCEFLGAFQEGTGNGLFRVLLKGVHLEGFAWRFGSGAHSIDCKTADSSVARHG
jgi:hypothetical protein